MQSASPNFWDAGRVSADGAYPISVNPRWEGQKRANKGPFPLFIRFPEEAVSRIAMVG